MRRLAPFSTFLRSFHRSRSVTKRQSELAALAHGEYSFLVLMVVLSDCRK